MALVSLTNANILLNASDISDHCSAVEINANVEELDSTTFGAAGWKSAQGGLKAGSLKVTVKGDYAASNIDSILWPLLGTVVTFEVRPVNAARSATNPAYTGSVLISNLTPVAGNVGDLVQFDLTWPTSGAVSRQTS